ncbi:MAG TPA: LCP family protein [Mycobacteriales bacterium]|nr:LCP family protein [Mycobacteriales bacterium]
MTGPDDGPPEGGETPARRLPPELDPRQPPTRRAARAARPADSAPPPSGKKVHFRRWRGWSRRRKIVMSVIAVVAAVVIFYVSTFAAGVLSFVGHLHHVDVFCNSCHRPPEGASGDDNILIVGSDSRAGLTKRQQQHLHVGHDSGRRSDTMILLHLPASGKPTLLSLPRDSYVTIPAHRSHGQEVPAQKNKLNAAYSLGGPRLTVRTVEYNTGVRLNHYIEINFEGFVNIVNALGGISICSATAIHDPVRREGSGYVGSGLELPKGTSTLNGTRALEYVRAREFDPAQGDLGRIQRQQKFMAAVMNKAKSLGLILNTPKLLHFLDTTASSLTVDNGFGAGQVISLARRLHSLSPKNVDLLTVPLSNTAYATPVGSAVLWDPVLSKRLFTDFREDRPITNVVPPHRLTVPPSSISLKVLNATSQNGLAAQAASDLSGLGFGISGTGNAPSGSSPTTTVVEYGPTRADSARTVAAAITGAVLHENQSIGATVRVLVGSSYEGVKPVHISSGTTTVRTGATNPCS